MTLNEIDNYLNASRHYIDNSNRILTKLEYCPYRGCYNPIPGLPLRLQRERLNGLLGRQNYLERIAWTERQRQANGMGVLPALPIYFIGAAIVSLATLGTYVYSLFQQSKIQSDYLNCLDQHKDMSPDDAYKYCTGQKGESAKDDITKNIKIAIYGAVAVMALYLASKFVGKKR